MAFVSLAKKQDLFPKKLQLFHYSIAYGFCSVEQNSHNMLIRGASSTYILLELLEDKVAKAILIRIDSAKAYFIDVVRVF